MRHVHLDLEVRFDRRVLAGSVTLHLERVEPDARTLVVDTRDLVIHDVELVDGRRDDDTRRPRTG